MASTWDMMFFPHVAWRGCFGCGGASGLGMVRQYAHVPRMQRSAPLRCAADPGPMDPQSRRGSRLCGCIVKNAAPRPGHETAYADAVVTPPSTTMVCPVMKLDASEPR